MIEPRKGFTGKHFSAYLQHILINFSLTDTSKKESLPNGLGNIYLAMNKRALLVNFTRPIYMAQRAVPCFLRVTVVYIYVYKPNRSDG